MKRRGVITLVFDDGYEHIYQQVVPLLRRYNVPAVFALPLNTAAIEQSEQRRFTPWKQWLDLKQDGHELAAHSVSHRNLTTLSPDQLETELQQPVADLGATTLVYPGGAVNDTVSVAVKKHYRAARTVIKGFESLPPRDPWHLKTYNFTRNNFSVFKANSLALWAYLTNCWLIETYHLVDDQESEKVHTVRLRDFERHLQFLTTLPVEIKTIANVI